MLHVGRILLLYQMNKSSFLSQTVNLRQIIKTFDLPVQKKHFQEEMAVPYLFVMCSTCNLNKHIKMMISKQMILFSFVTKEATGSIECAWRKHMLLAARVKCCPQNNYTKYHIKRLVIVLATDVRDLYDLNVLTINFFSNL